MKKSIVMLMVAFSVSTVCFAKVNYLDKDYAKERTETASNVWCGQMCDMDGGNCQNTCQN